jgi:F420-non-reducing hydrogenase iron-sulfur subunit
VLKAFAEGADGVLVSGCHPVDCHYIEGNYKMWARKVMLETMLQQLGIEPERFRLTWVSANEGELFKQYVTEMVDAVKKLGPFQKPVNWMTELLEHERSLGTAVQEIAAGGGVGE